MSGTMSDVAAVARFGGLGGIVYFCQSLGPRLCTTALVAAFADG